jgi:hypothetical protein
MSTAVTETLFTADTLSSADAGFVTDGFQLPLSDIFA